MTTMTQDEAALFSAIAFRLNQGSGNIPKLYIEEVNDCYDKID